jgi:hypothetical protein
MIKFELDRVEVFMILEALSNRLGNCQECDEKPTTELIKKFADELNEHMQKPQVAAAA